MNNLKNLNLVLEEIEYLKKSQALLEEIYSHLGPYETTINGKKCGDLPRRIAEHLHNFDDNE